MAHRHDKIASQKTVLVVDSHEIVREGVRQIISQRFQSCNVLMATDSTQAMQLLRQELEIDLVILELLLPGKGGLELIHEISDYKKSIPLLVHTANNATNYGVQAVRRGAWAFVEKQSGVEELTAAISALFSGRKFFNPQIAQKIVSNVRQEEERPRHEKLSNREFLILRKLGHGVAIKELAAELSLSAKTISTYRTRLFRKLDIQSLAEVVRYCIEHDLK
jgi:DNA-binding NarL/FixJ family response regulator